MVEYAVVHGPLGHEIARVCGEERADVRAYVNAHYPDATALSWVPNWRFNTADGFTERFTFRFVQPPPREK